MAANCGLLLYFDRGPNEPLLKKCGASKFKTIRLVIIYSTKNTKVVNSESFAGDGKNT